MQAPTSLVDPTLRDIVQVASHILAFIGGTYAIVEIIKVYFPKLYLLKSDYLKEGGIGFERQRLIMECYLVNRSKKPLFVWKILSAPHVRNTDVVEFMIVDHPSIRFYKDRDLKNELELPFTLPPKEPFLIVIEVIINLQDDRQGGFVYRSVNKDLIDLRSCNLQLWDTDNATWNFTDIDEAGPIVRKMKRTRKSLDLSVIKKIRRKWRRR